MEEDLAIGVGHAAIDGIAAHDCDDGWILPGLVFPEDLAVVVEVKRKDGVGERRMNIHHVADHQRGAFVTTQNACRKRPGRRDLVDVLGIDLLELGISRIRVILGRHHPLVRVRGQFHQFVVREGVSGRKHGRGAEAACKQEFSHCFLPVRLIAKRCATHHRSKRLAATVSWDGVDSVSRHGETSRDARGEVRLASEKCAKAPVPRRSCNRNQREDIPIEF